MRSRRVVTGHDADGAAIVVADGPCPRDHAYAAIPGMHEALAWATEHPHTIPADNADPTASITSYVPGPGSTRLLVVVFPPDAVFGAPTFDAAAAAAEQAVASPGLAETFEAEAPGMHGTPTVDYAFVLEGTIILDLDGGKTTTLSVGDIVVQNGTRHAWRNTSESPATVAFVLVGAVA